VVVPAPRMVPPVPVKVAWPHGGGLLRCGDTVRWWARGV
jgi:hypothetical protein